MSVVFDGDPAVFLQHAAPLLYQKEDINGLLIGIAEGLVRSPPVLAPVLIRIEDQGRTVFAAIQTPPHNLVLGFSAKLELASLARALHDRQTTLPGVVGPSESALAFSQEWEKLTGQKYSLGMDQKLYRLEEVIPPRPTKGAMRVATANDGDLVSKWLQAFAAESLPETDAQTEAYWRTYVDRAIERKAAWLWEHAEAPVSMAFSTRPTRTGVTLNCVYTPLPHRRQGYAGALVGHLSQRLLAEGKAFCMLYTDASNPSSNKIYQEVGYRPIGDSKHYIFSF